MSLLPVWARKPNHSKEVIATEKGWVVKDTGEVLRSDKHLLSKLDALSKEFEDLPTVQQEPIEKEVEQTDTTLEGGVEKDSNEPVVNNEEPEVTPSIEEIEPEQKTEEPKKKKPGRPKKTDTNKSS